MQAPIRAGIYARISHDPGQKGEGVDHQLATCRRELSSRAKRLDRRIDVIREWKETDVSAWTGRPRPSYIQLLEAIRKYEIDLLIVWHADRLHRRAKEFEAFLDVLEERDKTKPLEIVTVHGGDMDLNSAGGRLMGRIGVSVAQHESDIKRDRIKARFDERAKRGEPLGGRKLYGYDTRRNIVPQEAAFIKQATALLLEGLDGNEVCRRLNGFGARTTTGRLWTRRTLIRTLTNPGLSGAVVHRNRVIPGVRGKWAPILTSGEQERVSLYIRGWGAPSRGGRPMTALLSGILRCGKCGASLYKNRRADHQRIYWCQPSPNHDRGCGGVSIRADPLDEWIVNIVLARLPNLPPISPEDQAQVAGKLATIRDLETRLADYESNADKFEAKRFARITDALDAKLRRARSEATAFSELPSARALGLQKGDLTQVWPTLAFAVQRQIITSLIKSVTIRPVGKSRNNQPRNAHERIDGIVWRS